MLTNEQIAELTGFPLDNVEQEVSYRLLTLLAAEKAKLEHMEHKAQFEPAPMVVNLAELEHEDVLPDRIDGLVGAQTVTHIIAPRKAGKTTLLFNLARSLAHGTPFLGRYDTPPEPGKIAWLNYEMSRNMFKQWAADTGIDLKRIEYVQALDAPRWFYSEYRREEMKKKLQGCTALIVDSFARAFFGDTMKDSEVLAFLQDLTAWARSFGINEIYIIVHSGKDPARGGRGSIALEDYPDQVFYIESDDNRSTSGRKQFWTMGRMDHDVPKTFVDFDLTSRAWTLAESVGVAVDEDVKTAILATVVDLNGKDVKASKSKIAQMVQGNRQRVLGLIDELEKEGAIHNMGTATKTDYVTNEQTPLSSSS